MNWDLLSLLKQLVEKNQINISKAQLESAFKLVAGSARKQNDTYSLISELLSESNDTALGMKVGRLISPNSFYGLGYLFMTADNLLTACQKMCEFPAFYSNIITLTTETDGQYFVLKVENESDQEFTNAIINEASLGVIYQYVSWLKKESTIDCDIFLTHEAISTKEAYHQYFHRQPKFQSPHCQLRFPIAIAKAPLLTSEPEYHLALYSRLKEKHDRMSQNFLSRAQVAIRNSLKLGNVSRPNVAKQLSLSEKTLERRLEKNNFSFRKLTESVRLELAHKYLVRSDFSIDEIAQNLGYCDRNTFSKAFKKWTGMTPGQQRQKLQQQHESRVLSTNS